MSEREEPEVDPAELGNYEAVSGGETTPPSGDPDAAAAEDGGAEAGAEPEGE